MTLKPLSRLATPLLVLLKVQIVLLVIAVIFDVTQVYLFQQASEGVDVVESLEAVLNGNGIVGLAQVVLYLVVGIVFLKWKYRANHNLHELSTHEFENSPGWAVGSYFVPIVNLVAPYKAMKEVWTVAHRENEESTQVVSLWWAAWIISAIFGQLAFRMTMRADDLQSYSISAVTDLVSDSFDILLGIIAIVLVSRITAAYYQNYAENDEQKIGETNQFVQDPAEFESS